MRVQCRRKGYDTDGRPFCSHGPMNKNGIRKDGQQRWYCADAQRARDIAYLRTEKGKAKRDIAWGKFRQKIIRVHVGGVRWCERVPPERKAEIEEALRSFRAKQKEEYSEVKEYGWIN